MPIEVKVTSNFAARMQERSRKVERRIQAAITSYGVSVLADLIETTPIRSGQARSNWKVDINSRDNIFIELRETIALQRRKETADTPPDYFSTDDALLYGTSQAQQYHLGDTLHIYNNAPYIQRLNEGYSKQAPAGYIQDVIERNKGALELKIVTGT